jgi:rubrerythrin
MQAKPSMGMNRTGMQAAPDERVEEMLEVTELTRPPKGKADALIALRGEYLQDGEADVLGSIPPPRTVKGAAKAGMKALTGKKAHVLLDKLGGRLAFERSGTRLYEALIGKCETAAGNGLVDLARLRHFRDEEAKHFALVKACIEQLGGDATAQTPCADLEGIEGSGLMQAVTDPRTTVAQSLHAILVAELADNAAWEELVTLAEKMGEAEMAAKFRDAAQREQEHLTTVREWHAQGTLAQMQVGA